MRGALGSVLLAAAVLGACGPSGATPRARERVAAPVAAARPAGIPTGRPARPAAAAQAPQGFLGVLVAGESVDVGAEVAGRLRSVGVRAGDVVARGALLASLDAQVAGQDLEAARAVLSQAQIDEEKSRIALADAEGKLSRRQSFPEAFPKEELISAKANRDAAKAAVAGAEARVKEQRIRVEQLARIAQRGEVRAPFAGTVAVRYLDPGAMVGAGTPIVRLVGARERMVRFAIPEKDRPGLAPGRPVTIVLRDSGRELQGTIETISPEVDAASGMVLAEAKIDPAGARTAAAQPGEVVRVVPGGT
ncbi:MAG TPA: efflux RND transporter periplasmic adaptor subunit [Solirubrobacterales bacterium]|nr:efflux RND transporter periplasmic adaptor subunit [Solirubrobacterales bacterium]